MPMMRLHPDSLSWISEYTDAYGMVQVPVLPLATPFTKWTHGVYCDEFVEYQTRDMPARDAMRSFIPSCGVGTGLRRDAVELRAAEQGYVFEPGCLTEDYENGYRLRRAMCARSFSAASGRDGHSRALSDDVQARRKTANALGNRNRPADRGTTRLARHTPHQVLVVARSQGFDQQSRWRLGESADCVPDDSGVLLGLEPVGLAA